jgi:type 1 glutamine amidotransferase
MKLQRRGIGLLGPLLACAFFAGACGLLTGEGAATAPAATPAPASFSVLVFTKTAGFRHGSIGAAVTAIAELGAAHGFSVTHTEDGAAFSDEGLAGHRAVVFLLTSGDVLDDEQQAAFERYIRAGGGFVGVHSASDTEYDWPWYGGLVGAYFADHPAIQPAELLLADAAHPSTAGLPERWARTDEWYNFRAPPGPDVNVLLTIDESSYGGGSMGASHPMSWYQRFDGGRAWYTALGHTDASYGEPLFRAHLAGGILWAAGQAGQEERAHLPLLGGG